MPTIFQSKGFRFFFFRNDRVNSPHIHIESDNKYARFQLKPVEMEKSVGYDVKELGEIRDLINTNLRFLNEKWNGYFTAEN